jgi:predicted glycosyltransferase
MKLLNKKHSIIVLIKTKDVLEKLLKNDGVAYINIQENNRKNNPLSILFASFKRTIKVSKIAKENKVDLLIGTDSSVAQAAFLLRKKSITTLEDDYEVIKNLAKLTYPFTSSILVPTECKVGKWESKKTPYAGFMKLAYLHPNRFTADIQIKNKYIQSDKFILLRLAKLTAHHDVGLKGLNLDLIKSIVDIAKNNEFDVFISSEEQVDESINQYILSINQNEIHHVLAFSSLLISDSQSMSVEAAMLGVPSLRYSDFSGRISVLEELEHKYGLTYGVKTENTQQLLSMTKDLLRNSDIRLVFAEKRNKMLADKIDVTSFLTWFIENFPESQAIMSENPDYQYKFK